jgi:hypothetical protein
MNNEEFSLRDKENMVELETILDELLAELQNDVKKFKIIFKNLPLKIYIKIDTLRNISTDKKSDKFIEIAKKAKKVSKEFHKQFK